MSYLPYLLGAALSWCDQSADEKLLVPVLSRDVFHDPTQRMAEAAIGLGLAHRKLDYYAGLGTPLGTAISAPVPRTRELMCRDALESEESCGGHFRVEHQTDEGEALRDDDNFAYVAAWEWTGPDTPAELHKEHLEFEHVHLAQRSYK